MKAGFYLNIPQDLIRGSTCLILMMLSQCPVILYFISGFCDNTRAFEINRRAVIATLSSGKGLESLKQFCADMNMPNPMTKATFNYHACVIKEAAEKAAVDSMEDASFELHDLLNIPSTETADCKVMIDGTWRKRGHSSLQGDYVTVEKKEDNNSVEYEEFLATHKCRSNFSGSAGLMEPIGVQRIYARSMVSRRLHYTGYIGHGDTKSYSSVVKEQPYGPNTQIEKLECVGHVQKRLGNAIKSD